MFCTRCGSQVEDGSSFCDRCGADLRPAVQNNAASAQAGGTAQQAATASAAANQTAASAATSQNATPGHTTAIPTNATPATSSAPAASTSTPVAAATPNPAPVAANPVRATPASAQSATATQAPNTSVPPAYNPAVAAAGAATAAAAPAQAKEKKSKKGLIIGIAIVAVLLFAAAALVVYFNFFAAKPVYVVKQQVDAISSPTRTDIYERNDNGILQKQTTTRDGKTTTMDYKELVEGLSVSTQDSGKYELNSDGYVSYIEVFNASGKTSFTRSYEYYSPGIIKSTTQKNADGSSVTNVYDEEGWISQTSSTDASGKKVDVSFTYAKSDDGKTMTRTSNSSESTTSSVVIYDLDENGNVVSKYLKDKPASRVTYTLEKVDDPAKMIAASSRLKG